MPLRVLILAAAGFISGCMSARPVPSFLWPDCPGSRSATARAAGCMSEAMYDIALDKVEASRVRGDQDEGQEGGSKSEAKSQPRE